MDFLSLFVAFALGIAATYVFNLLAERRALSLMRAKANQKGREAQQEQAERLLSFMMEIKEAWSNREPSQTMQEFGMKVLPGIALKYPDIMIKFGGKLMKLVSNGKDGGLNDIASVLGINE